VRTANLTSAYFWVYSSALSMSEVMLYQVRNSTTITNSKPAGLLMEVITSHYTAVATNSIEEGKEKNHSKNLAQIVP
jgi:hypothetical protein